MLTHGKLADEHVPPKHVNVGRASYETAHATVNDVSVWCRLHKKLYFAQGAMVSR